MNHSRTYAQAIAEAGFQAMDMDESVFYVGQGTRDRGYIFGSMEKIFERFDLSVIVKKSALISSLYTVNLD